MKLIAILIASAFAVSAFAAEPAKKEEVKAPVAATTASAPAPTASKPAAKPAKPASAPAKADATKSVPAKAEDKKAEAPKK